MPRLGELGNARGAGLEGQQRRIIMRAPFGKDRQHAAVGKKGRSI